MMMTCAEIPLATCSGSFMSHVMDVQQLDVCIDCCYGRLSCSECCAIHSDDRIHIHTLPSTSRIICHTMKVTLPALQFGCFVTIRLFCVWCQAQFTPFERNYMFFFPPFNPVGPCPSMASP